jgi:hypothetical protein
MDLPKDHTMDLRAVRTWALDRAISEVGNNTPWELVFGLAHKYEKYILTGEWDTPVADAAKTKAEAATTDPADDTHRFIPKGTMKSRCMICNQLHGEGNHE